MNFDVNVTVYGGDGKEIGTITSRGFVAKERTAITISDLEEVVAKMKELKSIMPPEYTVVTLRDGRTVRHYHGSL